MDSILVTGNGPLHGTIPIAGAKNACLALMPATLLSEEPLTLTNAPRLVDVRTMSELLRSLGAEVSTLQDGKVITMSSHGVMNPVADYEIVRKMRASNLVLGPLVARLGHATVSLPGGCAIGARPMDIHIEALSALGTDIDLRDGYLHARAPRGLKGTVHELRFASVGATENFVMAAVLARGTSVLKGAAREPEIVDLVACLRLMGARIEGEGTPTITIEGVDRLGGATHSVVADRIELGTYMLAPAICGREVEQAPTREMLAAPREEYTRSLWSVRHLHKPAVPRGGILLELRHVDAAYGRSRVLEDVTLSVPEGRTLAIVGESGSGKSTLARVVSGLLRPVRGEVLFAGAPLPPTAGQRSREQLRRIQLVYQSADAALNPRQRVCDLVGRRLELYFGMRGHEKKRRVAELLDMVELGPEHSGRFPGELSGGQKQRVSIARALAARPALMICDEITSALDQIIQEEILKLLMRLQRETGVTYLFITHDIATVRAIADEIAVMHHGRVVQQGPKDSILSPPHPAYTARLLASVPELDPDWLTGLLARRRGAHPADDRRLTTRG